MRAVNRLVEYEAPSCFALEFHRSAETAYKCVSLHLVAPISFRPRRSINHLSPVPPLFIRETGKKISRPPPPPTVSHGNYGVDGGVVKNPPLVARAFARQSFIPKLALIPLESSWPSFRRSNLGPRSSVEACTKEMEELAR